MENILAQLLFAAAVIALSLFVARHLGNKKGWSVWLVDLCLVSAFALYALWAIVADHWICAAFFAFMSISLLVMSRIDAIEERNMLAEEI